MGLVEEKHQLRLLRIADLRQLLEQLGKQPQQEGRVELRLLHELVGGKNIDVAAAVFVAAHQIFEVEGRLAEEFLGALLLDGEQAALDGAD